VDRLYIERFLARWTHVITGDVLEVRGPNYTRRFGTGTVRSHVLDIDERNPAATIIGDLCARATLMPGAFDCVILTQTLHYVRDPIAAVTNLWTSVRPGGAILLTVPCLARIDYELPESDFWRWTPAGLRVLLSDACPEAAIAIEAGGNLVAALAFLLGLAAEDLRASDLAEDDPIFPVTACAAIRKQPALDERRT
jgi:SAM-dependent methyltransferase